MNRYFSAAVAVLVCGGVAGAATIADLRTEWSLSGNPNVQANGSWTYTDTSAPLAFIASWAGDPNQSGWGPAANVSGNFLPFFFRTPITYGDSLPGDVIVHTTDTFNGAGNGPALFIWTSSVSATVDISGNFWPTRLIGRSNDYQLKLRHGATLTPLASGSVPEDGSVSRANPNTLYVAHVPITAGDRLELTIVKTSAPGDFVGVNLTVYPACLGDVNGDRMRDLADLAILLSQYGCTGGCSADLDGNGSVELGDLAILLSNYGIPCP